MAVTIPFRREFEFKYGVADRLSPRIRRVVAENPSPFTFRGTGTYILGTGNVAVIDPGPRDERHIAALLAATRGERITHMLVTHTHNYHSPGCVLLREHCDAETYAFGPHGSGSGANVEEGGDMDFHPDHIVRDGDVLEGDDWSVECVHTPGHTSNHVCFQLREEGALFTGDHVMGWSTSVISPPDGDMGAYMASLEKLLQRDDRIYWPTHGPSVIETKRHVQAFIDHRREREAQIESCIADGVRRINDMVPRMYGDTPAAMYPAAARSVLAAIIYMVQQGRLCCEGTPTAETEYFLA